MMSLRSSGPIPVLQSLLLFIAFFSTSVFGHAYVQNVDIAGKNYTGWLPWTMPYTEPVGKSIVRNVPGDGPILDITSADLACNQGGEKAAALIANVNAGDSVKLTWNTWPADHVGPVMVYMANCGGNCMTFNPTKGNVWFKIDEYSINSQGLWGTLKLIQQGDSWTVTIPPTIKAGQYLLRAELLALHNAGQPQFYPSCSQLNIASSGSSVPTSSDLVAIPGLYANAGKAINGDVWDNGDAAYPSSWPVAGPAVVSWAKTGGSTGSSPSSTAATTTATPSVTKSSSAVPTSSASSAPRCKNRGAKRRSDTLTGAKMQRRSDATSPAVPVQRNVERHYYAAHQKAGLLKNKRGASGMRI